MRLNRFASTTDNRKIAYAKTFAAVALCAAGSFSSAPSHAASASSAFQVSVRVEKSCRLSSQALAALAASPNQTASVNCSNNGAGAAPTPVQTTVSSTWVSGTEQSADTKVVTLDF